MTSKLLITLGVCLAIALVGVWLVYLNERKVRDRAPATRAERAIGIVRFTPSAEYSRYRNQVRSIRRYFRWPSGRQWKRIRTSYPYASFIRSLRAGNAQSA